MNKRLMLRYVHPKEKDPVLGDVVIDFSVFGTAEWLDSMVTPNPDTIFFLTTETTDIFDEDE